MKPAWILVGYLEFVATAMVGLRTSMARPGHRLAGMRQGVTVEPFTVFDELAKTLARFEMRRDLVALLDADTDATWAMWGCLSFRISVALCRRGLEGRDRMPPDAREVMLARLGDAAFLQEAAELVGQAQGAAGPADLDRLLRAHPVLVEQLEETLNVLLGDDAPWMKRAPASAP